MNSKQLEPGGKGLGARHIKRGDCRYNESESEGEYHMEVDRSDHKREV